MEATVVRAKYEKNEIGRPKEENFWQLIVAARAGDKQAAENLIAHPRMAKLTRTICICLMRGSNQPGGGIEDLQQQTLISLWRTIERFSGESEKQFVAWVKCIARNRLNDNRRALVKKNLREKIVLEKIESSSWQHHFDRVRLIKWWNSLNERQHIIMKRNVEGYTVLEIGSELGKSKSQVQRDLTGALIKLEQIIYGWKKKKVSNAIPSLKQQTCAQIWSEHSVAYATVQAELYGQKSDSSKALQKSSIELSAEMRPLSEQELAYIRSGLDEYEKQLKDFSPGPLSLCVDGERYPEFHSNEVVKRFMIPIWASSIDVFGYNDGEEILLAVFDMPELETVAPDKRLIRLVGPDESNPRLELLVFTHDEESRGNCQYLQAIISVISWRYRHCVGE